MYMCVLRVLIAYKILWLCLLCGYMEMSCIFHVKLMFPYRMAIAINCGYARVAAFEIAQKISQNRCWQKDISKKEEKISTLSLKWFQHGRTFTFNTPKVFGRNVAALVPQLNKKYAACILFHSYVHFSESSWAKLIPEAKNQHSLASCTACLSCSPLH